MTTPNVSSVTLSRMNYKRKELTHPADPRAKAVPLAWALLADWLAWLVAGGAPATTVAARRTPLCTLAREIGCAPGEVTEQLLIEYVAGKAWAIETRRQRRASYQSFFNWAESNGHITGNPARALPLISPAEPHPRPVTDLAYEAAVRDAAPRERLMLRLGAELGLRRAEIAVINPGRDVLDTLDGPVLTVHGKGSKVRMLPLLTRIAADIRAGVRGYDPSADPSEWLFPGAVEGHLSARRVGEVMAEALADDWTAHKLRHRYATRAYRGTRNIRAVQRALGHTSVATTQIYTQVDDNEVRAAMAAAL